MPDDNPIFGRDPIAYRSSHVFGLIELYAPRGNPADWHDFPWIVTTEKGGENGAPIKVRIKAKFAHTVYERPSFVSKDMRYYE